MSLPPFPVDECTLGNIEHALDARMSVDEEGAHHVAGADFTMPALLNFQSGYDPALVEPLGDGIVEYVGGELYTRDDVIRALVAEVHRLRGPA